MQGLDVSRSGWDRCVRCGYWGGEIIMKRKEKKRKEKTIEWSGVLLE